MGEDAGAYDSNLSKEAQKYNPVLENRRQLPQSVSQEDISEALLFSYVIKEKDKNKANNEPRR